LRVYVNSVGQRGHSEFWRVTPWLLKRYTHSFLPNHRIGISQEKTWKHPAH
jgi:hypothetical protein